MGNLSYQIFNLLIWVLGVICAGSALVGIFAGSLFLHEDTGRTWLWVSAIVGVITIWLAPRNSVLPPIWLVLLGAINLVFLLSASRRGDRIYKLGSRFGEETAPPVPPEPEQVLPTASILEPLIKAIEARRKAVNAPPTGYWSVVFPNPMQLGQEHVVKIHFPPIGNDPGEGDDWLEAIHLALKKNNEAILVILPVAQSFDVKPGVREVSVHTGRRLTTDFFVTPTQLGKHPIRIEVHLGKTQLGWFQETIQVRINAQKALAASGTVIGVIATILSIMSALKMLP